MLTLSEFGRRIKENGSGGTDHGHGQAMLMLGGGVRGGQIHGDWPGLAEANLDRWRPRRYDGLSQHPGRGTREALRAGSMSTVFPGLAPDPSTSSRPAPSCQLRHRRSRPRHLTRLHPNKCSELRASAKNSEQQSTVVRNCSLRGAILHNCADVWSRASLSTSRYLAVGRFVLETLRCCLGVGEFGLRNGEQLAKPGGAEPVTYLSTALMMRESTPAVGSSLGWGLMFAPVAGMGLVTATDPFVEVRLLRRQGGGVAVSGVNDGLARKFVEQSSDGTDDRRKVREGSSRGAWTAGEERVTAEQHAKVLGVEADRAGSVSWRVQHAAASVPPTTISSPSVSGAVRLAVGVRQLPHSLVFGVQQNRCTGSFGQ